LKKKKERIPRLKLGGGGGCPLFLFVEGKQGKKRPFTLRQLQGRIRLEQPGDKEGRGLVKAMSMFRERCKKSTSNYDRKVKTKKKPNRNDFREGAHKDVRLVISPARGEGKRCADLQKRGTGGGGKAARKRAQGQ